MKVKDLKEKLNEYNDEAIVRVAVPTGNLEENKLAYDSFDIEVMYQSDDETKENADVIYMLKYTHEFEDGPIQDCDCKDCDCKRN